MDNDQFDRSLAANVEYNRLQWLILNSNQFGDYSDNKKRYYLASLKQPPVPFVFRYPGVVDSALSTQDLTTSNGRNPLVLLKNGSGSRATDFLSLRRCNSHLFLSSSLTAL
eukprot:GILK01021082.1.p1 GENE.GILK01021082.1~~GILK01021082.1.p1  ORF type:complete len:111 (+),score=16.50 GILK01021082.1:55-387(+)